MAQQPCNVCSNVTSQHDSQNKHLTAGPFLLLPPSSVQTESDVRCGKPSIVQAWEEGRRGSSTAGAAPPLNLPPSDLQHQVPHSLNSYLPHSMRDCAQNPAFPLKRLKLFSLNDYLGLSAHPDVATAAAAAVSQVRAPPRSLVFIFIKAAILFSYSMLLMLCVEYTQCVHILFKDNNQ